MTARRWWITGAVVVLTMTVVAGLAPGLLSRLLAFALLWLMLGAAMVAVWIGACEVGRRISRHGRTPTPRSMSTCYSCPAGVDVPTDTLGEHLRTAHGADQALCTECRQRVDLDCWAEHRRLRHDPARPTGAEDRPDWRASA